MRDNSPPGGAPRSADANAGVDLRELAFLARPVEPPKKQKGARLHPTEEQRTQVRTLAALLIPEDDIAQVVGISPTTLAKRFRRDLRAGRSQARVRTHAAIAQQAWNERNLAAAMFIARCHFGWREEGGFSHLVNPDGSARQLPDLKVDFGPDGPPPQLPAPGAREPGEPGAAALVVP
jgi:AraC-like DNA-binding protein